MIDKIESLSFYVSIMNALKTLWVVYCVSKIIIKIVIINFYSVLIN